MPKARAIEPTASAPIGYTGPSWWEQDVINLIARLLLAASAGITGWLVAKDSPNFGVVQAMLSVVLLAALVGLVALWPRKPDQS